MEKTASVIFVCRTVQTCFTEYKFSYNTRTAFKKIPRFAEKSGLLTLREDEVDDMYVHVYLFITMISIFQTRGLSA